MNEITGEWRNYQIHTRRKSVGLVSLSKLDLISIGDFLSNEFPEEEVLLSIGLDDQKGMTLSKFKTTADLVPSVEFAKLVVNRREGDGFVKQLAVVLGPSENFVEAQSIDESWAIGVVERTRVLLRPFELPKFLHFEGLGSTVNALIFFVMLAFLPSIDTFGQRAVYVLLLLVLLLTIKKIHEFSVPNAFIVLDEKRSSKLKQLSQKFSSIVIALAGGASATFVTLQFESLLSWISILVSQGVP